MASISEDRIREMEEEMNRFEKEISQQNAHPPAGRFPTNNHGPHPSSRPVIGSGTYHQVAEQLHIRQRPPINHPNQVMGRPPRSNILSPPCPPNFAGNLGSEPTRMSGPHPAGPRHLQFIPHQLRGPGPNMLARPPTNSINNVPPQQNQMGFQPNSNSEERSDSKAKSDARTSTTATIISTPVVISAKPTVYSKNPIKKIEKVPVKEMAPPVVEKKPPAVLAIPIVQPKPPVMFYNANVAVTTVSSTPAGPTVFPPVSSAAAAEDKKKEKKVKKIVRTAGGQVWDDNTLMEWELDDFRVFCGDLGNDVTDDVLTRTFSRYPSFMKARVVRDKRTNKTRGYGFVSFKDPQDFIKAMKEMNGKYVGSRPIKLRKSCWKDRNIEIAKKKTKEKQKLGLK